MICPCRYITQCIINLPVVIFAFLFTEPGHGGDRVGAVHCDPAEGESLCILSHLQPFHFIHQPQLLYPVLQRQGI